MKKELKIVKQYQKEISMLSYASALLNWDQETYMPSKGIESRSEQISYLNSLIHEKATSDKFFEVVKKLKGKLKGDDNLMIEKLHKDLLKARKIPRSHIEELSREQSLGVNAWKKAREKSDFEIFRPHLEKLITLKRKETDYIKLPGHIYNSLLDSFEEGMTVEELKPKFERLKKELLEIIKKIESSQTYKKQKTTILKQKFSDEKQKQFSKDISERIGLKTENSRIDFSVHPFSTKVGFNDVRITTNIRQSPMFSFSSTIHESGHALYELNLPESHKYDALGDAPSIGLHESQSRFWENMIGLSKPFWRYYFPKFKHEYKLKGDFEKWYKEVNQVRPGKIRIESDELHYCLHIILRFELEIALIEGKLKVKDLPKEWNKKMKEYFGIKIQKGSEGVLQDIHWSWGEFGYFPTYAIGTIYAAQLYQALKYQHPKIENEIQKGNFKKVAHWLEQNIHKHGRKKLAEELIKKTTGQKLNPETYTQYLKDKYYKLYNIQ